MEKPTEQEESCLQCLLGVDKRNPCLTVYRDLSKGQLQVYYGHELLEVVGDDREQVGFKILVGRLYNAGLKIGCLQRQFEVDPKTMKRWGEALQSGDAETLGRVLAGRRWHRKLTREIRSFVRVRFFEIYEQSFYYDPHTKHYTGMSKLLAGWCPTIRLADKALHSDFIHTLKGSPVYFASTDNYEDIRKRFIPNCEAMLELVECACG